MCIRDRTDRVLATFNIALQFSQKISDRDLQSWATTEIAIGLARVGQFDQALQIAQKVSDARIKSNALSEVAITMALSLIHI